LALANIQAMAKKPRSQASDGDGLRRYAEAAPTLMMREFANAAVWRGFTLGEIARRCSKQATIDSSNVRRYLESKCPRADTIEALRCAIGLTKTHVNLVRYFQSGEMLSGREYRQMDSSLRLWLALNETRFEEGAVRRALAAFDGLDDERRRHLLGCFELQQQRTKARMIRLDERDDELYPSAALEAFATALRDFTSVDLLKQVRHRIAGEDTLWTLWHQLSGSSNGAFTEREAEAIVHVASGLLRARGIDTKPMEDQLNKQREAHSRAELTLRQLKEEEE
jgi:hypothetical protein